MFEPPEFDPNSKSRLTAITLDEDSIRRGNSNIEHEREVAIFDILEGNSFVLEGRDDGPYTLDLSIVEDRLVFAVGHQGERRHLHRGALPHAAAPHHEGLLHRLRKLLPGDPHGAALAHPVDRHGAARAARRGQPRAQRAAQGQDHASTATPRGGCSRSSARCIGRDKGWRARGATTCRVRYSSSAP